VVYVLFVLVGVIYPVGIATVLRAALFDRAGPLATFPGRPKS
jgi:hypothetical protein